MGLEDILKQVEETGRDTAAAIRKETAKEVESKMAEARSAADEAVASIKSESNRKIEQLRQQEIPSAELEVKRSQLEMQKDLLMETKTEVMSKLENLSSKDLKKIYSSLLKDAPKDGKLLCRKEDKSLFKGITKLSHSGEITELGFVIESGDYRLDYRFTTLVERQWQENLPMVSEVLFAK
jgi:V/A-type H+-transporting ATPase subunit E|tara:strand:+ start:365 stop:907 length:543 start_codon:yes stop_codon:yes gene_type:complete